MLIASLRASQEAISSAVLADARPFGLGTMSIDYAWKTVMKTRDWKALKPSDSSFGFWPERSSAFAIARLFWMALGPGILMILCVLRMDSDAPNRLFLSSLFALTVFAMVTVRWLFFLSPRRDRHRFHDEWKNVIGFSVASVCLSAGIWLVAETVSDAQSMSVESSTPAQNATPMLSEGEMLTQTL